MFFWWLVLCVIVLLVLTRRPSMIHVWSSDGARQLYVKNLPDAQSVADHLQTLEHRMSEFMAAARKLLPDDPRVRRISERWNGQLSEVDDPTHNVAYSLGKSAIYICVRERDGSLASLNTCFFVLAHELAHVATPHWGHTEDFWKNMRFLLELGEKTGHYTYIDHDKNPQMLCGRSLGTSPATCVKETSCPSELRNEPSFS